MSFFNLIRQIFGSGGTSAGKAMTLKKLSEGFSITTQIQPQDVAALAEQGIKLIICNRPDNEDGGQPAYKEIAAAAKASGDLGLHLHVGPADRDQPDRTDPRRFDSGQHPARDAAWPVARVGWRRADHHGHRHRCRGLPLPGPQGARTGSGRSRGGSASCRYRRQGRPRRRRGGDDGAGLGLWAGGARRQTGGRGSAIAAALHLAAAAIRSGPAIGPAGAADFGHRLCRVDLGCPDACRQKAPADRPRSGTDCLGRGQSGRSLHRGLSGHGRLLSLGG